MRASDSLNGLRKEMLEFMRSCEALLSIAYSESLTEDEVEIVRHYVQWLSEVREATKEVASSLCTGARFTTR